MKKDIIYVKCPSHNNPPRIKDYLLYEWIPFLKDNIYKIENEYYLFKCLSFEDNIITLLPIHIKNYNNYFLIPEMKDVLLNGIIYYLGNKDVINLNEIMNNSLRDNILFRELFRKKLYKLKYYNKKICDIIMKIKGIDYYSNLNEWKMDQLYISIERLFIQCNNLYSYTLNYIIENNIYIKDWCLFRDNIENLYRKCIHYGDLLLLFTEKQFSNIIDKLDNDKLTLSEIGDELIYIILCHLFKFDTLDIFYYEYEQQITCMLFHLLKNRKDLYDDIKNKYINTLRVKYNSCSNNYIYDSIVNDIQSFI